ncbi:hypothetical protein LCGC14_0382900 [marine sediment metagenome]|uniref:Uncharacterized protein n=1 Tax=marine sediment metagenome TaxID=412755 RepID=A0A0F9VPB3_9ZZZZ
MQETPTPTAPVQPLEAEPQTGPAPVGAEKPQPSPEAAPAEPKTEAETGAEEEAKPWVGVKEVEGLREHVGPLLEDAEKTGYDKRTGEFDQYAQPYLQQHSQRLNDINSGLGRMAKGLEALVKVSKSDSGTVDGDVLTEWYDSHKETFEALLGASDTSQQFHGGKRLLVSIADAAGDQSVAQPFMNRLDMLQNGVPDPNLFHDFLKKVSAKSTEAIKGPLQEEITSLKAQVEDLKAKKRPEGPDTTQKGSVAADDSKRLLDPTTPIEEIREIRARQKAG